MHACIYKYIHARMQRTNTSMHACKEQMHAGICIEYTYIYIYAKPVPSEVYVHPSSIEKKQPEKGERQQTSWLLSQRAKEMREGPRGGPLTPLGGPLGAP